LIASTTVLAAVTVTITAAVVVTHDYRPIRCPRCQQRLADGAHASRYRATVREDYTNLAGGLVLRCPRSHCKVLVEVVRHG
jgi:uncharacterized protein CbrC (UPF0167 family)